MAIPTFTIIPDGRLAPDAPVRSVDALALRDNPLAIAKASGLIGDPDPQVATAGIADGAVTTVKMDAERLHVLPISVAAAGLAPVSNNFMTLDSSIDWRGRMVNVQLEITRHSSLAFAQAFIVGGASDQYLGSQADPTGVYANTWLTTDDWMYTEDGSASGLVYPVLIYLFNGIGSNAYIWVDETTGVLMLTWISSDANNDHIAVNGIILYTEVL